MEKLEVQSRYSPPAQFRTKDNRTFSMGGKVYEQGIHSRDEDDLQVRFLIPKGMHTFHADFGVSDDSDTRNGVVNAHRVPSYELLIDGVSTKSGELKLDQTPATVDVDVSGKRSAFVRLKFGAGMGEPTLSSEPLSAPGRSGVKPVLLSPKDGASVAGDTVNLKWKAIDGAVSYGITIVALKFASAADPEATRMWVKTVSATSQSYGLSLKELPEGQYLWTVIAFGAKEPIGVYSTEQLLSVEK